MSKASNKIPILLVDDLPANRLALKAVLNSPEYDLIEANSGAEALEYLKHNECAVILLDVQMPDMDGFETASFIRRDAKTASTPIIFVTASIENTDRIYKGYEVGAVDYIFKPFEPIILRSKVAVFVELYKAYKEISRQSELLHIQELQDRDSFLEVALDAVIGMNDEGIVTYWNAQATQTFGWSKEEAVGRRMSELIIPAEHRTAHEMGLQKFLTTGIGPILRKRIEINALKKNGTIIPVELSVTPLKSGKRFTFSAFVRDISEQKKVEAYKILEQEKLQKAINARDEFIGICSHELKTPITSLKLQFQLAAKQYAKDDPRVFARDAIQKRISNSITQLERMTRLIDDMLDVSKISAGKLVIDWEEVDIAEVMKEVIDRFDDQLSILGISLSLQIRNKHLEVYGDKFRLDQVITNLLTNAIKYGDGKSIEIELSKKHEFVVIKVQDHGLGINEENLERIFNRYERAISATKISGLGLGLYITEQIVHAHHGRIEVISELGKGSTFSVELPLLHVEKEFQDSV